MSPIKVKLDRVQDADHRLLASLADVFAVSRGKAPYVFQPNELARTAYDHFLTAVASEDPSEVIVIARHPLADDFATQDIVGVGHARLKAPWTYAVDPKLDILSVSVLPNFRSQRIGEALVAGLEFNALPMVKGRDTALERVIVPSNAPAAIRLFFGIGFRPVRSLPGARVMTRVVEPAAILAA